VVVCGLAGLGGGEHAGGHAAGAGVRGDRRVSPGAEGYGPAAERAAGGGQGRGENEGLSRAEVDAAVNAVGFLDALITDTVPSPKLIT
jgi:hypothetical protein